MKRVDAMIEWLFLFLIVVVGIMTFRHPPLTTGQAVLRTTLFVVGVGGLIVIKLLHRHKR